MVVIDDPASILRCTNKIYLRRPAEVAQAAHAAAPRSSTATMRKQARRAARHAGLPDRAEDPGRLVLARHRQGRERRAAAARGRRPVPAHRRCCSRRSSCTPSTTGASACSTARRCTPASTTCRAATGRSTTTARAGHGQVRRLQDAADPRGAGRGGEARAARHRAIGDGLYGVDIKQTEQARGDHRGERQPLDRRRRRGRLPRRGSLPPHHGRVPAPAWSASGWASPTDAIAHGLAAPSVRLRFAARACTRERRHHCGRPRIPSAAGRPAAARPATSATSPGPDRSCAAQEIPR